MKIIQLLKDKKHKEIVHYVIKLFIRGEKKGRKRGKRKNKRRKGGGKKRKRRQMIKIEVWLAKKDDL